MYEKGRRLVSGAEGCRVESVVGEDGEKASRGVNGSVVFVPSLVAWWRKGWILSDSHVFGRRVGMAENGSSVMGREASS